MAGKWPRNVIRSKGSSDNVTREATIYWVLRANPHGTRVRIVVRVDLGGPMYFSITPRFFSSVVLQYLVRKEGIPSNLPARDFRGCYDHHGGHRCSSDAGKIGP